MITLSPFMTLASAGSTSRRPAWLQRSARPSAGLIASWLLPPIMEKSFSRPRRTLSPSIAANRRIDSCALALARSRRRKKGTAQVSIQLAEPRPNSVGRSEPTDPVGVSRTQFLGTGTGGCSSRRGSRLRMRCGLHQPFSKRESYGTSRAGGARSPLQTRPRVRSPGRSSL